MGPPSFPWIFVFALTLAVVLWKFRRDIADALHNFRGGPPRPMHPSPAADGAILRRRAKRVHSGS